ncbi:MAG: cell division protein FtsZ [Caldisericota bacterium]|jgi:cell division protein FtsZ|nr:cell division protein FtsZ [Caldisericota bacterium]
MDDRLDPWGSSNVSIKVVGIGGGGGNAINRMVGDFPTGVDFVTINTDTQVLRYSKAESRVQIGAKVARGMGAGADPEIGRKAAEESREILKESVTGASLLFITAGMGGGTGTGASPIVAKVARELGILTVAIVTKPFNFEGPQRARVAADGIRELRDTVDGLVVIPNQRLFKLEEGKITISNAFRRADEVLKKAVQGITELIRTPGIINLDFADLKNVLTSNATTELPDGADGSIWIGMGSGRGDERASKAIRAATNYELLEYSMKGATGLIYNVIGHEISMEEMDTISTAIQSEASKDAKIIFGLADPFDEVLGQAGEASDEIRITVVASGMQPQRTEVEQEKKILKEFKVEDVELPAILRKGSARGF